MLYEEVGQRMGIEETEALSVGPDDEKERKSVRY